VALCIAVCLLLSSTTDVATRQPSNVQKSKRGTDISRVFVIDGSPVHNIGNLHLHTGNWGAFGSMPGSTMPFADAPSAEWPAGSGVEYLYVAGLWVGAIKGGVPAISTSAYEMEFRPTQDPIDVVYYAAEGSPGGKRLPNVNADDDGDGMIDEEWLDGHDNDADAAVDEDYAAISEQMQSCWYTDDQPEATVIYPTHNPLHITVHQRSFQWSDPDFDDFVAFDYTITNTGPYVLEDVFVGVFVDGDVGSRDVPNYWEDDATGFSRVTGVCTPWGAADVEFAYVYDADGDQGQTPGKCGLLLLDHTTDPTGVKAPVEVGFSTYQVFYGSQSYEEGGDPTNDFERYEVMSSGIIDGGSTGGDARFLVAVGPFPELAPGESLHFRTALFVGTTPGGVPTNLNQNAAAAKLTYRGKWYDVDGLPTTGVAGRETPVYGPASDVTVDSCQAPPIVVPWVPHGEVVWTNDDCAREESHRLACGYTDADSALFRTGIAGKETQVNWILPTDVYIPVLISGFHVDTSPTAAELSWQLLADEPILGFRILRAAQGQPIAVLPEQTGMLPPEARSFNDAGVTAGRSYQYTLIAVREDGSPVSSGTIAASIPAWTTVLHQNYPNPFNPATTISFTLAEKSRVNLSIYTPEGKQVVTLVDQNLPAGFKTVPWDGKDSAGNVMSTGVYFYRLKAGKTILSRKMVYLK
jgi:hypothetical protein